MILKLLRNHFSTALVFLAIAFLVVIIGFYIWGIGYMVQTIAQTNVPPKTGIGDLQFHLDAAAKLDYRGTAPELMATGTARG